MIWAGNRATTWQSNAKKLNRWQTHGLQINRPAPVCPSSEHRPHSKTDKRLTLSQDKRGNVRFSIVTLAETVVIWLIDLHAAPFQLQPVTTSRTVVAAALHQRMQVTCWYVSAPSSSLRRTPMHARFISSQSAILRSFSCLTHGKHGLWAEFLYSGGLRLMQSKLQVVLQGYSRWKLKIWIGYLLSTKE